MAGNMGNAGSQIKIFFCEKGYGTQIMIIEFGSALDIRRE